MTNHVKSVKYETRVESKIQVIDALFCLRDSILPTVTVVA